MSGESQAHRRSKLEIVRSGRQPGELTLANRVCNSSAQRNVVAVADNPVGGVKQLDHHARNTRLGGALNAIAIAVEPCEILDRGGQQAAALELFEPQLLSLDTPPGGGRSKPRGPDPEPCVSPGEGQQHCHTLLLNLRLIGGPGTHGATLQATWPLKTCKAFCQRVWFGGGVVFTRRSRCRRNRPSEELYEPGTAC